MGNFGPFNKWKKKWSTIRRIMVVDCVANPFVLVTGAAIHVFHLFWSVGGMECIDHTWDRVTGKHNPGPIPPGAPGSRPRHRRFGTQGTATPPTYKPTPGSFGNTMIDYGNMAQKAGFFLAIIDGVLDGAIYGMTFSQRYSGCQTPGRPYAQMGMSNAVVAFGPPQTFYLGQWNLIAREILTTDPGGVGFPSGLENFTTVSVALEFETPVPGIDATVTWEVVWLPSGQPVQQHYGGAGYSLGGGGVFAGMDTWRQVTDSYVTVRMTKSEGFVRVRKGSFNVFAGNYIAPLAAYECKAETKLTT